jgi:hypothetical protein
MIDDRRMMNEEVCGASPPVGSGGFDRMNRMDRMGL